MSFKWDLRYMKLAQEASLWSKDPRKKVGAVLVDADNFVTAICMNGLPKGVPDDPAILNNPEIKNKLMIHAEMNVLSRAHGVTIYVYPCLPCTICMGLLIQRGIKRIVVPKECLENVGTKWDPDIAQDIAEQAGVKVDFI